jgi:GH24 family phage-related lysozyme (muramidase)
MKFATIRGLCLLSSSGLVAAVVQVVDPTTNCQTVTALGKHTCCSCGPPNCTPASPLTHGWSCIDLPGLACPLNSAYRIGTETNVNGDICYSDGALKCPWTQAQYTYTCCACPAGFLSVLSYPNCDPNESYGCVGCSGAGEVLSGDRETGWKCSVAASSSSSRSSSISSSMSSATSGCAVPTSTAVVDPDCGGPQGSCPYDTFCATALAPEPASCPPQCAMNNAGLNLLKFWEKGCPQMYTIRKDGTIGEFLLFPTQRNDFAHISKRRMLIHVFLGSGWGHDCTMNKDCDRFKDKTLTLAQADALVLADLAPLVTQISGWENSELLNANQLAAILDLGYNAGLPCMRRHFKRLVEGGKIADLCDAFASACVRGSDRALVARRQAEADLCSTPTTRMSGC